MTTTDVAHTLTAVTPYLAVRDAQRAIQWYGEVFGAQLVSPPIVMDDGRIGHCELSIGGAVLMMADEFPEIGVVSPLTQEGSSVAFVVEVPDVDATFAHAVREGATAEREPSDQFHGSRTGWLKDPFGHRWSISTSLDALGHEAPAPPDNILSGVPVIDVSRGGALPKGQLGYFTLTVPDVARATSFYGALFGWSFDAAQWSPTGRMYAHVNNTEVPFGFVDDENDPSPHHYYRVADIEAAAARVRELGGEVLSVDEYPSGGNARCRDDQGVEFELWQPAPGY